MFVRQLIGLNKYSPPEPEKPRIKTETHVVITLVDGSVHEITFQERDIGEWYMPSWAVFTGWRDSKTICLKPGYFVPQEQVKLIVAEERTVQ